MFHIGPAKKYNQLYQALFEMFKKARNEGRRIDFDWLWSKDRIIYRVQQNGPDSFVRKHVIVEFIKMTKLKLRRPQRNRKPNKEHFRKPMIAFYIKRVSD